MNSTDQTISASVIDKKNNKLTKRRFKMGRFKLTFNEKWEYDYNGHKIAVTNGIDKCALEVDGKTQDVHNGLGLSTTLTGKVDDKPIKVSLGGFWTVQCDVFVDHEKLELVKKSVY